VMGSERMRRPVAWWIALATYRSLQGIKATYDPEQVIISAHPIQPHRR
jgi:hypothetical protein